ncbi:hypothetical protein [Alicyclobacillus sp. SO9]|uniref:hypothetical protein n=1 Tax=Alicyclobacillus sp. SO9 TaxID=2665646 RepID=UPI0018E7D01A|nr:hypothetical protein [Alicyclobacillus sp. SO9]QQE78913.1 hypothetical protein GI364_24295 [Alicyclobacillus sp. SO9]
MEIWVRLDEELRDNNRQVTPPRRNRINRVGTFSAAAIALFLVVGGLYAERNLINPSQPTKIDTHQQLSPQKLVTIKTVITKEDPHSSDAPMTVVAKGLQYKLSNAKMVSSTSKDMKWAFSLAHHSIVAASVPDTSPKEYSLVTLLHNSGKWAIAGITNPSSVPPSNFTRDSLRGIDLPHGEYATMSPLPFGGTAKGQVWYFSNKNKVIVIAKYLRTPFSMPKGAKQVSVHGSNAWVITKKQNAVTFAFTLDEGNVVLVGGDVNEKQAIAILKSLPLASSGTFPFSAGSHPTLTAPNSVQNPDLPSWLSISTTDINSISIQGWGPGAAGNFTIHPAKGTSARLINTLLKGLSNDTAIKPYQTAISQGGGEWLELKMKNGTSISFTSAPNNPTQYTVKLDSASGKPEKDTMISDASGKITSVLNEISKGKLVRQKTQ